MTIQERNKFKAEIMTKLVGEIAQGQLDQFVGKIGKEGVQQFLVNIDFMAEEILKRSKL